MRMEMGQRTGNRGGDGGGGGTVTNLSVPPRRWAAQGRSVPRWTGTAASSSTRSSRSSTGCGNARPPTPWPASALPPLCTCWVSGAPSATQGGQDGRALGSDPRALLSAPVPGTSPHAVTNVSVLPLLLAANISWEPGFDGGYFQRFSVWYTPL